MYNSTWYHQCVKYIATNILMIQCKQLIYSVDTLLSAESVEKSKKDAAPVSDQTTKTSEASSSKQLKSLFLHVCNLCGYKHVQYKNTRRDTIN